MCVCVCLCLHVRVCMFNSKGGCKTHLFLRGCMHFCLCVCNHVCACLCVCMRHPSIGLYVWVILESVIWQKNRCITGPQGHYTLVLLRLSAAAPALSTNTTNTFTTPVRMCQLHLLSALLKCALNHKNDSHTHTHTHTHTQNHSGWIDLAMAVKADWYHPETTTSSILIYYPTYEHAWLSDVGGGASNQAELKSLSRPHYVYRHFEHHVTQNEPIVLTPPSPEANASNVVFKQVPDAFVMCNAS